MQKQIDLLALEMSICTNHCFESDQMLQSHNLTIPHVLNGILRHICGTFPSEFGIFLIRLTQLLKCHEMAWLLLYSCFLRTYTVWAPVGSLLTVPGRWFCCGSLLPVFDVGVSMTFHITCVRAVSCWWQPFRRWLRTRLAVCPLCV